MPPETVAVITFALELVINVTQLLKPPRPRPNVSATSVAAQREIGTAS